MTGTNPKKQHGALKAPYGFTPDTALAELEAVMAGGAEKYGAFNFRESKIDGLTYIGAIRRHLALWADGDDRDEESGRSHLAHIMACCALALDAQHTGMFEDNRSKTGLIAGILKDCADTHNSFVKGRKAVGLNPVPWVSPSYPTDYIGSPAFDACYRVEK